MSLLFLDSPYLSKYDICVSGLCDSLVHAFDSLPHVFVRKFQAMQDVRINNLNALEEAASLEGCSCECLLNRIVDQYLGTRRDAAIESAMKERRVFPRKDVLIPARVFILLKDSKEPIQLEGVISNISLTGARIHLHDTEAIKELIEDSENMSVGLDFKIDKDRDKVRFRGETRHLSKKSGSVELGIAFKKSNNESLDALYRFVHCHPKEAAIEDQPDGE